MIKKKTISVSDHAVLRFMERMCGIEIEPFREQIRKMLPENLPDGRVVTQGNTYVCENNTVITVL